MSDTEGRTPRRRNLLTLAPLLIFAALALLFFVRLFAGDASRIPSALIGQSAPPLDLPALDGAAGLRDADLRQGHVSVINIFASWCLPCHEEHAILLDLAADKALAAKGVKLIGVAQKDDPENVRRFLGAKGDPYANVGVDRDGRAGIDWGVYGVPETFIVKGDGTIAFKLVGPMNAQTLASVVRPQIEKAMN
ncbi:DsbE family thiol:disulfide interchange protein [Methylocapsa sp. S129]|uniref:DsbE family thiol:disulfide interchange protein n=1 Tax=Methylocapsa sp. S129 TaxID=1641869 RepID=UPI00131B2289|nr:DsbE family thiol:disulfide interchange protein [Methylocapsa sp. S129]